MSAFALGGLADTIVAWAGAARSWPGMCAAAADQWGDAALMAVAA